MAISDSSSRVLLTWVCLLMVMVRWASGNSDVDALTALENSLSDPNHELDSWDPTLVDPCTWFHITCDQSDNRVVRVDLQGLNLGGKLVGDLGKLDRLQYLELYKNNIEGTILSELGNLKNLISLDLYNNNLSGSIPPELGQLQSLAFLRLNDNKLTGEVPKELSNLHLKVIDLTNNNLSGPVPPVGPYPPAPLQKTYTIRQHHNSGKNVHQGEPAEPDSYIINFDLWTEPTRVVQSRMESEGGKKLAVLAGCNYPGTDSELKGCYNDVLWMGQLLVSRFGFSPDNIVVMLDSPDSSYFPTGDNILASLFRMFRMAQPGDVLFFHFSGHGTQIPSHDGTTQDEAIVPCDFNLITDLDFRMLVNQLPRGASFTFLSDSCHSGGLIDKEKEQLGPESTPPDVQVQVQEDTPQEESTPGTKARSIKHKHLPHNALVQHMRGFTNKDASHVRDHLTAHFGAKASSKFRLSPAELELYELLHPDMGVLLSGCQPDELSADVRQVEEGEFVAFGALSNAVQTVLHNHPGPLSNRELAVMVRETLKEQGFSQHPCLYCSDDNAASAFLGQLS